jgi:glucose/arabinose dehydrogenase
MTIRGLVWTLAVGSTLVLAAVAGRAQQPAPAKGKAAKAPTAPPAINWPSPPLADGPIILDTGIQHQIRLIVTKGLNQPWSMAFLPDGGILITERPGRLRIVRNGALDPNPVAGVPQVQAQGLAGLMDLALHPRFSENQLIYFTYHKPAGAAAAQGNNAGIITLARGRWNGTALIDVLARA